MKDDLRKMEAGGVSSHDLYVKREFDCTFFMTTMTWSNNFFYPNSIKVIYQWLKKNKKHLQLMVNAPEMISPFIQTCVKFQQL